MSEKPQLVLNAWSKGEPLTYKCSLCGQMFLFPEDRSPKEGVAEIWVAFRDHVREQHGEHNREDPIRGSTGEPERTT